MRFLKEVKADLSTGKFEATFFNGKKSTNKTVADFYMVMQDKNCSKEEVKEYVKIGRMTDFQKPWDEIEEILGDA